MIPLSSSSGCSPSKIGRGLNILIVISIHRGELKTEQAQQCDDSVRARATVGVAQKMSYLSSKFEQFLQTKSWHFLV